MQLAHPMHIYCFTPRFYVLRHTTNIMGIMRLVICNSVSYKLVERKTDLDLTQV